MTTPSDGHLDVDAMIRFAQDLVRVRSVHDPALGSTEAAAAALVEDRMRAFGWSPTVTDVAPGRPNVVAVIDGGGGPGPTLAFEGHTDVVTEGDRSVWTRDPYGAEIVDGRLYGRGAADMKSGVAAMMYAVRALELDGPFPGRVVVAALADEEGLMLGAKHFTGTEVARSIDAAIVCEPEAGEVCVAAKGAIRLRVDFTGAMAHGAMPQHGRNPLAAVGPFLQRIAEVQAGYLEELGTHPHLGDVYLTPTVTQAGDLDQINVIPASAVVAVDVRTTSAVAHDQLITAVAEAAEDSGKPLGVSAHVTVVDDRPAVEVDTDDPVVRAVVAAHTDVHGAAPVYGGVPGATDGTILTRDLGIPTVVYGPGGKWIAHQADEYVELSDIEAHARVYVEAARRYLTSPAHPR